MPGTGSTLPVAGFFNSAYFIVWLNLETACACISSASLHFHLLQFHDARTFAGGRHHAECGTAADTVFCLFYVRASKFSGTFTNGNGQAVLLCWLYRNTAFDQWAALCLPVT